MAKLKWEISNPGYGVQREVTANTRADAIAAAEALYLQDNDWELELVGTVYDDGTPFQRSAIPAFVAKKIKVREAA